MVNLIYFLYKVWYLDQGIFVSGFCFCLFMFNWSSTICFLLYLIAFTIFVKNQLGRASLVAQWYRICLPMQETKVQSLIWGDPTYHIPSLEKEMATHPSVLAWRIPGMAEPGGLRSLGSHRVGHDWSDLAAAAAAHTTEQLSPCATTTEPVLWSPRSHNYWSPRAYSPCSTTREVTAMRSPHTTTRE